MGIKVSKKLFKATTLLIIICTVLSFFTNFNAEAQTQQDTVRVAIGNSNYSSLVYNNISIIANSDYSALEKTTNKPLVKLTAADVLKIKLTAGTFELFVNNKSIAKTTDSIIITCPKGLLGVQNLKRAGKQALYHGDFEINQKNENLFYLINVLDLQSYLRGVVPNEMPVRFGLEALKAQSVAARNYVLTPRTRPNREFDVDDSVASQVYFGANTESELSNQAVAQTEGVVALYGWDMILAQYSSTAGGYTESYENAFSDPKTGEFPAKTKPYLIGRPDIYTVGPLNREEEARLFYMGYPDSYDMKSPYYRWKKEWAVNDATPTTTSDSADKKIIDGELNKILAKTLLVQSNTGLVKPKFKSGDTLGEIKELKVVRRGVSGKVMELEIITDGQTYHVSKELVIRRLLPKSGISLPSANVVFDNQYDSNHKLVKVVAYGGGFGHGVGMSQFGAGFMATSLHKPFDKILKRYYTGITLSTTPVILSNYDTQKIITQNFYAPYKKATLVLDNKYQLSKVDAKINGKDVTFQLEKSLIPTHRINRIDISNYIKQGKNTVTFYYPLEEGGRKGIRLYIELVEKDDNNYNF